MLKNNFWSVEYDYDSYYSCSDSGCDDEGICRCCQITNAHVYNLDLEKIAKDIYSSVVDISSVSGKREQKLNEIFYGGKTVDEYCIGRILSHYKLYNESNWEVEVSGSYYGDEIDGVSMCSSLFSKVESSVSKLMELTTLSDKIKFILSLEYGYLLDDLKDCEFELVTISKKDIDLSSSNKNHIDNVIKEKELNGLSHYRNITLPKGVVRIVNGKYKIVDGYHRIIANKLEKFEVFCVKN
jgi:hypothetical protein